MHALDVTCRLGLFKSGLSSAGQLPRLGMDSGAMLRRRQDAVKDLQHSHLNIDFASAGKSLTCHFAPAESGRSHTVLVRVFMRVDIWASRYETEILLPVNP
jgi:hypothetical protein